MIKKSDHNKISIVEIDANNISEHPEVICFINPKHEAYPLKLRWLKKRFKENLKIILLYREHDKRCIGFIEYLPGEFAWRAVDTGGYLFIHCIWIYKNINKNKGYASILINECIKDATAQGSNGIAVIASDGPFIAGNNIFLKNGFRIIDTSGSYTLLLRRLKKGPPPKFTVWKKELKKYKGWNVIYSMQCPWAARSIHELKKVADENGLTVRFKELKTARQAQRAPSIYSVFTLVRDGRILADHYISAHRFRNILRKELSQLKS